jgi:Trk K+ transport system NAD-binding subunit
MDRVRRRALYYVLSIAVLILVFSVVYDVAMKTLEPGPYPPEGIDISLFHSLQVVVETFTATGYGSDSPWKSPTLNLLIVLMDLTGVALFFLALPIVLVPLFQESLTPSAPTTIKGGLSDHVIICTYTPRSEVLIDELTGNGIPYVLVEPDPEQALALDRDGYTVVNTDPESVADLTKANIEDAQTLVADVSDQVDASIVLAAKEAAESTRVISVVEDPDHESFHRLAGADSVLTPRQLLGVGLAQKVTTGLSTDLEETIEIGDSFDVMEVPVSDGSRLDGTTLAESDLRQTYDVNVVGAWYRGEFETPVPPDRELDSGTILLVAGNRQKLEALAAAGRSTARKFKQGNTVVIGHGEVGRTVTRALDDANLPYTVVDVTDGEDVDVVGDATDPEVLKRAGVPEANSVVLAIPDDTTTEFATLAVRDSNDSTQLIVRADNVDSIQKMYRAGADYVLSLATVSGRSIASEILDTGAILSVDTNVNVVRTEAPGLVGETVAGANVRNRTGCTIVAVERDGERYTVVDPDFQIQEGDTLVVAGTDEGTSQFQALFR